MYINFEKILFVITYICPGRCAHCQSASGQGKTKGALNPDMAEKALRSVAKKYTIGSVLMFGGEPMLYPDTVCRLVSAASDMGIEGRGIITSGFVKADNDIQNARKWARELSDSGIVNVLLSVDVFHEKNIPFEPVYAFAGELIKHGTNVQLHPAWVGGKDMENEYNIRTRQVLDKFSHLGLLESSGNIVFPSGNANVNLRNYFQNPPIETFKDYRCGDAPYTSPLNNIGELAVEPDGNVKVCDFIIGNIYEEELISIAESYDPYTNEEMSLLIESGPYALYEKKRKQGTAVNTEGLLTACDLCSRVCHKGHGR